LIINYQLLIIDYLLSVINETPEKSPGRIFRPVFVNPSISACR